MSKCKHENQTPIAGKSGRFHCDDCGENFTAAIEKPKNDATCKTMHLNQEDKKDAARLQAVEDLKNANAAAKAVVETLKELNQLCHAADEAEAKADRFFCDRIINDKKFRTDIETVQTFFQHHHPTHPPLEGKNGTYHRGIDWSEKELGKNYDYICRKLREYHKAQFVINLVNPPAPPPPEEEKPKLPAAEMQTPATETPATEKQTPATTPKKQPRAASHEELKAEKVIADEAQSRACEANRIADFCRAELISVAKFYNDCGDEIQPPKLRTYLKELPKRLAAFEANSDVEELEKPHLPFADDDNGDRDLEVTPLPPTKKAAA